MNIRNQRPHSGPKGESGNFPPFRLRPELGLRVLSKRRLVYHLYELKINSAEDFIKWAGTKSEKGGKPYMVRCGNEAPIPTSKWPARELKRYRRQKEHAAN